MKTGTARIIRWLPPLAALGLCLAPALGGPAEGRADYHYAGSMTLDPASGRIEVDWTLSVYDDAIAQPVFLLRRTLADVAVTGDDVQHVEVAQSEAFGDQFWEVRVDLADAADGSPREMRMTYGGVLLPEPLPSDINSIDQDKVELTVDSMWSPTDMTFARTLTAEVDISIPGEWTGVSTGAARATDGGVRITNDIPGLDIPITLMREFRRVQTDNYTIYDLRQQDRGIPALIEAVGFCTDYLNEQFGETDPLPRAKIVVHDRQESGYSRGVLIALTDTQDDDPQTLVQFLAHELAHYWSRHGAANTVENWLNESFADYAGLMAVRERFGEEAFQARLTRYRKRVDRADGLPPIWTPQDQSRRPYLVNYRKGPLALSRLEEMIGRDTFAEFMRRYMNGRVSTTPQMLRTLKDVAGAAAAERFKAMLAEPG